jgi:hypothetical protein
MAMNVWKTEEIRGVKYEIHVDDKGRFCIQIDGDWIKAPTFESLKKRLSEIGRVKQKNIAIPFVYWEKDYHDKGKILRGVCVGIHAGNNNLLVKYGNEKTAQQLSTWRMEPCLDPKHADRLETLNRAVTAAEKALEDFVEKNKLDLPKMVAEIIGKEEPGEEPPKV